MLGSLLQKFAKYRRGAVIVVFALCLPILIGAAGMVVDVGFWYLEKRRLQEAADSGAIAAASEFVKNPDITNQMLDVAAKNAVKRAAYTDATVHAHNPPVSGFFTKKPRTDGFIEVIVWQAYSTYFVAIFGFDDITIAARAVAVQGPFIGDCILAKGGPGYANAPYYNDGRAVLDAAKCNIHANGEEDPAVDVGNNVALSANCLTGTTSMSGKTEKNYVGPILDGHDPDDEGIYTNCGPPKGGRGPHEDPFDKLTANDMTGEFCKTSLALLDGPARDGRYARRSEFAWNFSIIGTAMAKPPSGGTDPAKPPPVEPIQASPGVYCDLGTISADVNFAPGVYFIRGGAKFHGTVTGDNVLLILQGDGADIDINGHAGMTLSAPSKEFMEEHGGNSGMLFTELDNPVAWSGVLIYNDTEGTSNCSTINGNSKSSFTGAIYMPKACLKFNGNASISSMDANEEEGCLVLNADNIKITGNTKLTMAECEDFYGERFFGSATTFVGLVE